MDGRRSLRTTEKERRRPAQHWRPPARLQRFPSELGIPCAEPVKVSGMARCPRHSLDLGPVSRLCPTCHDEAWTEVGARYASAKQGRAGKTARRRPTDADRPPLRTFPGSKHTPFPGQLALFEDEKREEETMSDSVIDAETGAVELHPLVPTTLFHTSDPDLALARMRELAKTLVQVVEDRKLYVVISGRKHLLVSAWTTLGAMLGLFPIVVGTRPNETGDGYIARVEVRTREGELVGAAEAECSRAERTWAKRDPFSLRAMAQTRATSRALRGPLEQVVILAEYEPASVEEMAAENETATRSPAAPVEATGEQFAEIGALISELSTLDPETDWKARTQQLAGVPARMLTRRSAETLISKLGDEIEELRAAA